MPPTIRSFFILLTFSLCFFSGQSNAQTDTTINVVDSLNLIQLDSSALDSIPQLENIIQEEVLVGKDTTRDPAKAFMYSALYPGLGQFYNKQYWKTPIFGGAFTTGLVLTINNRVNYVRYRNEYAYRIQNPLEPPTRFVDIDNSDLLYERVKAKRSYNANLAATCFIYGINMLDAYISASALRKKRAHSPVKAAYFSTVLPGWGQAYNKKYWKIPIVYAGLGVCGYFLYDSYSKMNSYTKAYIFRNQPDFVPDPVVIGSIAQSPNDLLRFRERYKSRFETFVIITTAWYILNILDATVDGHLYEFDEQMKDDLSIGFSPYIAPLPQSQIGGIPQSAVGMSMSLTF